MLSGFTDASGDPAKNEELAKQRAFAVRDALKTAVAEDKIDEEARAAHRQRRRAGAPRRGGADKQVS